MRGLDTTNRLRADAVRVQAGAQSSTSPSPTQMVEVCDPVTTSMRADAESGVVMNGRCAGGSFAAALIG